MKYKLRIYKKRAIDRGALEREEFFETKEEAFRRYNELFNYNDFGLNPTVWKQTKNGGWKRIAGY